MLQVIKNNIQVIMSLYIIMDSELDVYPSLDDPNFNIKIANKKEFNDTSIDGTVYKNIEERADQLSNSQFEIASHQLFVKSFLP